MADACLLLDQMHDRLLDAPQEATVRGGCAKPLGVVVPIVP